MKQRKLKSYVLPTLYVTILMIIFGTVSLISTILSNNPDYLYTTGIIRPDAIQVGVESKETMESIGKPYINEKVEIDKYFYDVKDEEEKQQKSLIYFQNTYMKNTGVLYKAEELFDVVAVLDGTVIDVKTDELLGMVVEVEHNTNLRTIYYSLDNVELKKGDVVSKGELIGKSGGNNISDNKYNLLFEVYYNGVLLNPLKFYEMDPATLT